jgi:MoaA/NifB/PqqE/SkfB family radical SAM enzyme
MQLGRDMNVRDRIPLAKMLEIIDDITEMGVEAVTFSGGGDPFCYPHLLDAAKRLSRGGVRFASLTNGSLLSGEIAEFFAHHATWLRVSMDGWDDDSYRSYRDCADGEYSRIMQNMMDFKSSGGRCYLGVSLIIDRGNAFHVFRSIEKMKSIGVDSVKVAPCVVSNSGAENNLYHKEIFPLVKEQTQRALTDLADDRFEVFDSYHQLDDRFSKDYTWCPYLQVLPIIGADLNVYSCQDKAYNLDEGLLGSIKEIGFKDFWFSGKEKFFTINPQSVCNHHCVANAKNRMLLEYLGADREHLGFV